MKHLILGGARSGKSRFAEQQVLTAAAQNPDPPFYVATATAGDAEMAQRILQHQSYRSNQWQLIEEPVVLSTVLETYRQPGHCLLIDCLTLWISNCLVREDWAEQRSNFLSALEASQATIFLVSNEVGSGIVPLGELSRQFVDESGRLHQELASYCDRVTLIVAGLPMPLKPSNTL